MVLEDLTPPVIGRSCKVATVAATLADKDKEILLKAVMDKDLWPVKTLSRSLSERGIYLSDTPISNHRSKSCVCFA
jgi:hypothetical protein